jgi:hypothetical protein
MFSFLEKLIARKAETKAEFLASYRKLVAKLVADGDLSRTETVQMEAALDRLGFTAADLEADVAAMKKLSELETLAAQAENLQCKHKETCGPANAAEKELPKKIAALHAEVAAVKAKRLAALMAFSQASRAAAESAELKRKNRRLFGGDDVADMPQGVYLRWGFEGEQAPPDSVIVSMFDHAIEANLWRAGKELARHESQSPEEFTALKNAALAFRSGARYLKSREQKTPTLIAGTVDLLENLIDSTTTRPAFSADYVGAPGLSAKEHRANLERLAAHYSTLSKAGEQKDKGLLV